MKKNQRTLVLVIVIIVIVGAILLIQNPFKKKETKSAVINVETTNLGTAINNQAPAFILNDLESKSVKLSNYKGKKHVILNFWASWCPPCREEMPAFQQLHQDNPDTLAVIGVNLQEDLDDITEFLDEYGITYPILLDPGADVKKLYNVITQPVTYFITKDGIIQDKKQGPLTPEEISEKVGKLLNTKPVKSKVIDDEIKTLPDGTKYIIHPNKFLSGGPPKDGIPSIDNPKFISPDEADWLPDEELGLGITYKGESRFYPFRILVNHEMVNDFIQDDPVLVTYCPLCFTGIGFIREIDGEAVEFGVSGKLYNSELVMYDRKTDSYWPQTLGKAVLGSSTGKTIKKIPTDTVKWGNWKKANPDTTVLSQDTGFFRSYNGRNPYGTNGDFTSINLRFPIENEDSRLSSNEIVYGIEVNGAFKAYSKADVENKLKIEDTLGGEKITVEFDKELESAKAFTGDDEPVIVETIFWFAWSAFHPDTELYNA